MMTSLRHLFLLLAASLLIPYAARADSPWPAVRCLVWARPGESGLASEPANWTEYASSADHAAGKGGKPASKRPDANTDVVLPDAPNGKPYVVGYMIIPRYRKRDGGYDVPHIRVRHVTIGRGAGLDGGAGTSRGKASFGREPVYDTTMGIFGNVTVADGGYIYGPHMLMGGRSTFFRVGDTPEPLSRSLRIRKTGGASVTLEMSNCVLADGVTVESGRLVLAAGTHLRFGAGLEERTRLGKLLAPGKFHKEHYVFVHDGAALELAGGSSVARAAAPGDVVADLRIDGVLQIGSPGEKASSPPAVIELESASGSGRFLDQPGGLYLRPSAKVKNFGRLSITARDPNGPASADTGVSIFLEAPVDLGRADIDYLRAGGIVAADLAAAKTAVAQATFGSHCAAAGEVLLAKLGFPAFAGGWGAVEFVDGLKTECEVLYPHAGRLIVRGKGHRTLQSFDLASVHAVTVAGMRTEYHPKRPLTDAEKKLRDLNALWGDDVASGQVGRYAKQRWPHCPVLVWRRPGVSGSRFTGPNWLDERGVPWFGSPVDVDPNIDMLLPAAAAPYAASGWSQVSLEGSPPQRHLTIERNAAYGSTFNVQGNLWMKHGSGLGGWHRGRYCNDTPNLHRFDRFDGRRLNYRGGQMDGPLVDGAASPTAQWGHFVTGEGATIELIGRTRAAGDRLYIDGSGTLIVSEGSVLADGNRSGMWVMPGATLAVLQDARVGSECTRQHPQCYASIMVSGTLMVGLPEKPITRDMVFPLSGVLKDSVNHNPPVDMRSAGCSFVLSRDGQFVVHSADPASARVVFKLYDTDEARRAGARYSRKTQVDGIALFFGGKADLNGVVFDTVVPGGIMASPGQRAKWKNVSYGENNLAAPDRLHYDLK